MSADDDRMSLSISLSLSTISFRFWDSGNRHAVIRSDVIDLSVVQPYSSFNDIQRSTVLPQCHSMAPLATTFTLGQVHWYNHRGPSVTC